MSTVHGQSVHYYAFTSGVWSIFDKNLASVQNQFKTIYSILTFRNYIIMNACLAVQSVQLLLLGNWCQPGAEGRCSRGTESS